ncbi:probable phosphatase phospho1 [Paramormyrops kingsleyae]|uniref:probable phosphatase phospho1 n=1 Tax=Paramormyrops kingsleyae TaxID=1676925 RepID=UPI003B96A181
MEDQSAPSGMSSRFLIIFDFDETIVHMNSDDAVVQVAPGKQLPDWLKDSFRPGHFNENTHRVLAYMAEQGVSVEAIRSAVEQIPPSPGILNLFQFLQAHPQDFETVLVSDANMYFIEAWLHRAGARQLFLKIFTNPASINTKGQLQLLPYHSHNCPSCPDNMCKQVILQDYLARRTKERGCPFQRVCYVGDGANDFCPSLALGPSDVAFPREGYPMHKMITATQQGEPPGFKAAMVPWVSGEDVVAHLKRLVEER